MPEINIKLGDFVRNFIYGSQYIEIVKCDVIVFCGLAVDFLESIKDSESVENSVYFVDYVLPVASARTCTLLIYVREEKI